MASDRTEDRTAYDAIGSRVKALQASDVEWVVNDIAELGVKIEDQFFFLYKGHSLVYGALDPDPTVPPVHDDGTPMHWRPVFKREFGECAHPVNYSDPSRIGTVSLDDSDEWKPLPAARALSTHTAAGAGPVGNYVLVPREPTEAMLEYGELAQGEPASSRVIETYRAMLAARPGEEPGEVERDSDEESYQIGKRDGYEDAVQHIDERTGGDGEYVAVVGGDPEGRNCPDAPSMVAKIVARFEAAVEEISRQTVARGEEGLRAETAEAALAETRKALSRIAGSETKDALAIARAALTGDAQEAGR